MVLVECVPTYEYQCDKCERTFEVRQRITEPPLTVCEQCGGPVRRLLSAAPFILKGEGWYVTDYPSEARKKAKSAESSPASAPETASKPSGASSEAGSSSSGTSESSGGSAAPAKSAGDTKKSAGETKESPKPSSPSTGQS